MTGWAFPCLVSRGWIAVDVSLSAIGYLFEMSQPFLDRCRWVH